MNDPLGDMLTRIRNAQERRRPKVSSPASKLRERVLDVLVDEGYIRGYARVDHKNGLSEFEIELKYANGQPAIREIKRVSKPGRRVYKAVRDLTTRRQRAGRRHPVDAQGRDVGLARPRGERRRRDPVQRILRTARHARRNEVRRMSRIGKRPVAVPSGVTATVAGQKVRMKGPKGELAFTVSRADQGREDGRRRRGVAARGDQAGAGHVGHGAHADRQPDRRRDQGLLAHTRDPRHRASARR